MSAPGSGEGAAVLAQSLAAYGCRHVFGVVSPSPAAPRPQHWHSKSSPPLLTSARRLEFPSWSVAWRFKLPA
jgi:hypothetical protein